MRKFVWKITRVTNKTSQISRSILRMSTCCIYAGHTTTTHTPDEAICSWGILPTPPARLRPKLGAFLVVEVSVVHAGREWPKHARSATSQGIDQANRDDPHCSAAGTAVLSSPDEVLRCHPAALCGTIRLPPPYRSCSTMAQFAVKSIPHGLNRHFCSSS